MVWFLTLIGAVIPAVLLLIGVRWAADRFEPGYGTAAAITLGVGTMVMTFAAEFFSHVISAGLAFGAFCVLMKERDGPPSWRMVSAAGLLAGLAVTLSSRPAWSAWCCSSTRSPAASIGPAACRRPLPPAALRGGRRRRPADAGFQPVGVRQPTRARLRERGREPGPQRA